jgi:hypothetical protein
MKLCRRVGSPRRTEGEATTTLSGEVDELARLEITVLEYGPARVGRYFVAFVAEDLDQHQIHVRLECDQRELIARMSREDISLG